MEDEFAFETSPGVTYELMPAEGPPVAAEAPVITRPPADATVGLPSPATFTVMARGAGLRYQWQKNRVDIPGATLAEYTTPPTTLWDLGSEYRCVVSNAFGLARSHPGRLHAASGAGHPPG